MTGVELHTKEEWASWGDWVPVGIRLPLADLPEMTGDQLWAYWCGDSRTVGSCGQYGRLVALELRDAGGVVADLGRAGLVFEVARRDSV